MSKENNNNNNNEFVILRKVPLEVLLDTLERLFNMGVDFIDISGKNNVIQDSLGISFVEDYLTEDSPLRGAKEGQELSLDKENDLTIKTELDNIENDIDDIKEDDFNDLA